MSIDKDDAPLPSDLLSLHTFEDSPRTDHPSTIITHQNIQALPRIGMRDQQIFVHHLSYELIILTTTVYEIIR